MMTKFPVDPPLSDVIKALNSLGFETIRTGNHISMVRKNSDGTTTPLTIPNHRTLKGSTLRTILTQSGINRDEFLNVYKE
ncbi:MAG: type II toxin-antitoxin system HicA family toxin [Desulfamplus sp.]|nr:type II toxin-antitoxin system HicA family toxin [Desulfamplus sp.]